MSKVFSWCTDFEPDDVRFSTENKARRIISKEGNNVVFENEADDGSIETARVTLIPPNRWEAAYDGVLFDEHNIYSLEETPEGNTKFTFVSDGVWKGRKSSLTQEDAQKGSETFWNRAIAAIEKEISP
ncbi:MAG: hypothetical protein ACE5KO_03735 [Candidatus Bathyarchaeia archaeon]